jgi:hypothetical protein
MSAGGRAGIEAARRGGGPADWPGVVFHLDGEAGFAAGEHGEQVIQDLFRRHAERAAMGADLAPAVRVAEIALREIPRAEPDEITVIGELHKKGGGNGLSGLRPPLF